MRTPNDWRVELEKRGLSAFAPLVLKHLQPCVRVSLQKAGEYDVLSYVVHDETTVGSSKLGGYPDVPPDFVWPTVESAETGNVVAVPFLAQICLDDLGTRYNGNALPHTGLLSFFFDFTFLSEHGWRVFYFEDEPAQLERRPVPSNIVAYNESHYFPGIESPYQLRFRRGESIPFVSSVEIEAPFERIAAANGIIKRSSLYHLMDAYNALCFDGGAAGDRHGRT